jgi:hypothetical protein
MASRPKAVVDTNVVAYLSSTEGCRGRYRLSGYQPMALAHRR